MPRYCTVPQRVSHAIVSPQSTIRAFVMGPHRGHGLLHIAVPDGFGDYAILLEDLFGALAITNSGPRVQYGETEHSGLPGTTRAESGSIARFASRPLFSPNQDLMRAESPRQTYQRPLAG
jgi:hypothetical protein